MLATDAAARAERLDVAAEFLPADSETLALAELERALLGVLGIGLG